MLCHTFPTGTSELSGPRPFTRHALQRCDRLPMQLFLPARSGLSVVHRRCMCLSQYWHGTGAVVPGYAHRLPLAHSRKGSGSMTSFSVPARPGSPARSGVGLRWVAVVSWTTHAHAHTRQAVPGCLGARWVCVAALTCTCSQGELPQMSPPFFDSDIRTLCVI